MTAEFISSDKQEEETGAQEIFGLKLTTQVQAIGIAVLGILLAGGLAYQFVLPEFQKGGEFKQKITESKQTQLQLQAQIQKKAEAEAKQEEAKQRRANVTAMFASDASANTVLLDMTQLVNRINAGVQGDDLKAKITKFEPYLPPAASAAKAASASLDPDILTDTSFGPSLAGKLRRKKFKVEFEGNFAQTRNFMRNLELLQSLLVVRNLKSELISSTQAIEVDFVKGKIIPVAQPETKIKTAFDLHALLPLKQEEKPPTPAPSPGAK
ncbi:pilus assembly protein PilO [Microcoleus sp. herbarium2]|uniref:pilus assembly protein PilO n=1 Tax=Microcoleus sp. herbarium2 TaxID=3055433 RepID=UPI002FCFE8DC